MPAEYSGGSAPPVPASMLARLISDVWDPIEVKVVLSVAIMGGTSEPVRESFLIEEPTLRHGARADGSDRDVSLRLQEGLDRAIVRGLVLRLLDETGTRWLLLGTDENQRTARAPIATPADISPPWHGTLILERPSIFTMYEQNIGLVTPIIADRLVDALERYPETWIEDAIGESVNYNRRNWRYIQRILENWAAEGRNDEADRRGAQGDITREKHLHGKYSHLFRRGDLPDL